MTRRDRRAFMGHALINNLSLAANVAKASAERALLPPRAKDGPLGRINHERAIAAAKRAEAEATALSIDPAETA
jgi:hypothetical protein